MMGSPVHGRMFSSSCSLYPLDANSTPSPVMTTQRVSRHWQMSPGGAIAAPLRATGLECFLPSMPALFFENATPRTSNPYFPSSPAHNVIIS